MKECFKCHQVFSLDCFYNHSQMKDGTFNKCKECTKKDNRQNRKKKVRYYRAYDENRYAKKGKRSQKRIYKKEYVRKWRSANKIKAKAHNNLANAIRKGIIVKPKKCEACMNQKRLVGHHEDYTKPLDVFWCCDQCHKFIHGLGGY